MHIRRGISLDSPIPRRTYGRRTVDFLKHHSCAKGFHMRYDELLIRRRTGRGRELRELSQTQCRENSHDIRIVRKIEI